MPTVTRPILDHRSFRRAILTALVALVALLRVAPARAGTTWDTEPTNRAAIDQLARGRIAYKLQKWDEAVAAFEAGAMVEPSLPIWLWNLGQTHRQAGHYEQAKWYFERFITEEQDDPEGGDAVKLARQFVKDLDAAAKREPRALPPDPQSKPMAAPHPSDGQSKADEPLRLPRPETAPPWYADGLGWGLVGTGVISLGVGGGFTLDGSSLRTDADRESNEVTRLQLYDKADSRERIGWVTLAAGAGLIVGGVIKLAIAPNSKNTQQATIFIGASAIGVAGRF
jgi:tetratricopeptide (TPR) repeat protein